MKFLKYKNEKNNCTGFLTKNSELASRLHQISTNLLRFDCLNNSCKLPLFYELLKHLCDKKVSDQKLSTFIEAVSDSVKISRMSDEELKEEYKSILAKMGKTDN